MRRLMVVMLLACGSKPAPAPVSNTAPSTSAASAPSGGSAKVIQRSATGGVVELSGNRDAAMQHANEEIGKHCEPAGYVIVQEGEEVVSDTQGRMAGTAWRVHYRCDH